MSASKASASKTKEFKASVSKARASRPEANPIMVSIGLALAIGTAVFGAVVSLKVWKNVSFAFLSRDIVSIGDLPAYAGFMSQLGVILWFAAATVCIIGAKVLAVQQRFLNFQQFLWFSGLLTILLGLDDAFLLHERFLPNMGIPEKVIMTFYGSIVAAYACRFLHTILSTQYVVLVSALMFFGVSISLDLFPIANIDPYLFEDGAKMVGIIAWFVYFYQTTMTAIRAAAPLES